MNKKVEEKISPYPLHMDTRIALLEQSINNINQSLFRIENNMSTGFKEFRSEMKEMRGEFKSDFRWLIGIMIAFGSAITAIMAHGFHWF